MCKISHLEHCTRQRKLFYWSCIQVMIHYSISTMICNVHWWMSVLYLIIIHHVTNRTWSLHIRHWTSVSCTRLRTFFSDTQFCVVIFTDQIDIYRAKEHVMLWPGQLRSQGIGAVHGDHSLEGGWWVSDVWQAGSGSEDEDWDVACQCRHNTISCTSHDNSSTLATHLSLVTSWNIIRLEAMIMAW